MKKLFAFGSLYGAVAPLLAQAQTIEPPRTIGLLGGGGSGAFIGLMCLVAQWVFTIAIVLSIILAIMAGIQYMTAGGDSEKLKTAHRRLLYLAIGIAVAIIAQTLPVLVGSALQAGDPAKLGGVCS